MKPSVEVEEIKSLKEELQQMKQRLSILERTTELCNFDLYEPLCGHRLQAAISLLKVVRDKLDEFVKAAIANEAKSAKEQAQKDAIYCRFGCKSTYLQLMGSSDPLVAKIVTTTEENLLAFYAQQGIPVRNGVDVKRSMKAFERVKRTRDHASHIFDYNFNDGDRATVEEKKNAWPIKARILQDITKAMEKGWLPELVIGIAEESLLHLEVQRKTLELEAESQCTIHELSDMPYKRQKRKMMEAE